MHVKKHVRCSWCQVFFFLGHFVGSKRTQQSTPNLSGPERDPQGHNNIPPTSSSPQFPSQPEASSPSSFNFNEPISKLSLQFLHQVPAEKTQKSTLMASSLQLPISISSASTSSFRPRNARKFTAFCSVNAKATAKIPIPPINPKDPFLSRLAAVAAKSPETLLNRPPQNSDSLPYLDVFDEPILMATPAQVERSVSYNEHRPRKPPPDLPSLLLHGRIVYIGMPLVPAVTELIVAELMYLQWMDPKQPIYIYINSTGTTRDDGETVGMESEGFAIYDAMMQLKNEIHTVAVGAAIGQACLLLSAGTEGKRFMMPHAKAMIQQPRVPSSGLMPASDVLIRAKEVITNRDILVKLLAKHTGNSEEAVAKVMRRPFYMDSTTAKQFGVIDKILWRGQEKIMADVASPEEWDKTAGVKVVDELGGL
nr:ATP-dependent Clp protease proteolytic subunit-related protein 3, chloroplastic-like [Malus domestica]XP_008359861.2 ATP-dependent Clp protease proteolytic subunit-related protein 3, chloroplastic-like [Malus domestica]